MCMIMSKGQNVELNKLSKLDIDRIIIGLNWYIKDSSNFDLNASAFLISSTGFVRNHKDFIFYNQVTDVDRSIYLNTEVSENNDIRSFDIVLSKIPSNIQRIVFVLTIDDAIQRDQNFGLVDEASIRIANKNSYQDIIRYELLETNNEVSIMFGELYRHSGEWKFKAVGQGFSGGLDIVASEFRVDLGSLPKSVNSDDTISESTTKSYSSSGLKKKRRSPNQILSENSIYLKNRFEKILPQIASAVDNKINESNTRMILDRVFVDIFGYNLDEVKAEQRIQGRIADYVLSVGDDNVLVVEVKKAGMKLRAQQVFQATSYGAYSGIQWAILTNLSQWQIYYISMCDKVEYNLVFEVNLESGLSHEDARNLNLISRYAMSRKGLLKNKWDTINALSRENITSALMTEDIFNKIRLIIKNENKCNVSNEEVQNSLENILKIC